MMACAVLIARETTIPDEHGINTAKHPKHVDGTPHSLRRDRQGNLPRQP